MPYLKPNNMEYGLNKEQRQFAARRIQLYWRSYQDRRLFRLLMYTVRSAEHCLTPAVLRQLSPKEAQLLRDPSMHCKVRFRFSGCQFPPVVVFKIFHQGGGGQYISGKKVFRPSIQATADTCRMMGNRKFLDLVVVDEIQRQGGMMVDSSDITCMRDYMQYSSLLDELPAYLGGRENSWRSLSLKVLSRHYLLCDTVEAGGTSTVADRLKWELLSGPLRSGPLPGGRTPRPLGYPAAPPSFVVSTPCRAPQPAMSSTALPSTRRSARARSTATRMRRLYTLGEVNREEDQDEVKDNKRGEEVQLVDKENNLDDKVVEKPKTPPIFMPTVDEDSSDNSLSSESEWEEEAEKLCSWSKQLTIDDMDQAAIHT